MRAKFPPVVIYSRKVVFVNKQLNRKKKTAKFWTEAEVRDLIDMHNAKERLKDIAKELKRTPAAVAAKLKSIYHDQELIKLYSN